MAGVGNAVKPGDDRLVVAVSSRALFDLEESHADVFFDDQRRHMESAHRHVPAGHVPHGVANEEEPS